MPIGIVSDDDLEKELSSYTSPRPLVITGEILSEGQVVSIPARGRKEGDTNVPDSLRRIIGEDALLNGRASALQIAEDFGISASSVAAYTKGSTSTASYNEPSKSIIGHINKARERAIKRASKTLNGALAAITQEKLDYTDADKLSGIAKDMSAIIKNLEPKDVPADTSKAGPQFVIFSPQFRDERTYETIVVQE